MCWNQRRNTFEVTELGIFEDVVSELLELKSAIEAKASSETTEHLAVKECIVAKC